MARRTRETSSTLVEGTKTLKLSACFTGRPFPQETRSQHRLRVTAGEGPDPHLVIGTRECPIRTSRERYAAATYGEYSLNRASSACRALAEPNRRDRPCSTAGSTRTTRIGQSKDQGAAGRAGREDIGGVRTEDRRPRYLLSGLIKCGSCGGGYETS